MLTGRFTGRCVAIMTRYIGGVDFAITPPDEDAQAYQSILDSLNIYVKQTPCAHCDCAFLMHIRGWPSGDFDGPYCDDLEPRRLFVPMPPSEEFYSKLHRFADLLSHAVGDFRRNYVQAIIKCAQLFGGTGKVCSDYD